MKFTKMHGIGNDYVYVNCFEEELAMDPGRLAELVSDRHCGIGSDGLIPVSYTHLDVYKRQALSEVLEAADDFHVPAQTGG